jgi:3-carboxy-cis,cis-muconate cycloisomerase
MPARLIEALNTTERLADLFSDESVLRAMLQFEVSLAQAEARVGIIPKSAAKAIASASQPAAFDLPKLARSAFRAGTPAIPLVKALTEIVKKNSRSAAGYVHWGATSQDVADTALVLLLKQAQGVLESDIAMIEASLEHLSDRHKGTVMLGRTLLQPAPPITFGLKVGGWLGALRRCRVKLDAAFGEALMLQFGGASGTLASLGKSGVAVSRALAQELGLAYPNAPWHTQRDRLAWLMCACGVLTGTLGKMARDVSLMMQNEVAEVSEPGGDGRGGSSTMPHKRNPIACALTLSAATRVPHLVACFLSAMPQEHERGIGGWHSEWPTVASVIQSTGVAAASMAEVAAGLSVDAARMRENLEATHGLIFAEKAMMLLAPELGRDAAHRLLHSVTKQATAKGERLSKVLARTPEATRHMKSAALAKLEAPEEYLGSAELFRRAQLESRSASSGPNARPKRRK